MTRLSTLIRQWFDRGDDPAWRPTGIRQIYTGHDEAKATAAAQRQQDLEAHIRWVNKIRAEGRPDE